VLLLPDRFVCGPEDQLPESKPPLSRSKVLTDLNSYGWHRGRESAQRFAIETRCFCR
jgi:hypothetical protein